MEPTVNTSDPSGSHNISQDVQIGILSTEIRTLKDDVEDLSTVIRSLTDALTDIQRSMDRYKGIMGGISLTLVCVWTFFTFFFDRLKGL